MEVLLPSDVCSVLLRKQGICYLVPHELETFSSPILSPDSLGYCERVVSLVITDASW